MQLSLSRFTFPLRSRLLTLTAATFFTTFTATAQAPGDLRVALVIGNAAYAGPMALANPANDAKAMSDTLRGLGFSVVELRDGTRAQMAQAIGQVRDTLKGRQGVGMLYYAGHGLQQDARNYMVPVDARLAQAADVAGQTVDVAQVIEAFKTAGNRMNIVVLDACRDNPFGGITTGKGLAPLDAPSGTFLAYATAPGNVAEDGDAKGGNGLYTQYLLAELKKPQATIENVFKRVRFAVRKASGGRQIPWESTSLEDDFSFNDGRVVALAKPTEQQLQTAFSQEKPDWERIKDSTNADDFYAFLQKYPNGTITEAAHARLNQIAKSKLVVQGGGADGGAMTLEAARFALGDSYSVRRVGGPRSAGGGLPPPQTDEFEVTRVAPNGEVEVQARIAMGGGAPPVRMSSFYTAEGANLGNSYTRFNPPQAFVPGGLMQPGERWQIAYEARAQRANMSNVSAVGEGRILARERVTVPAGTFDTFKIHNELNMQVGTTLRTRMVCTVWISPKLPTPIKTDCENTGGMAVVSQTELVSYKRTP